MSDDKRRDKRWLKKCEKLVVSKVRLKQCIQPLFVLLLIHYYLMAYQFDGIPMYMDSMDKDLITSLYVQQRTNFLYTCTFMQTLAKP